MGDRAQYFLEQSVPELLDLQEKKIFTPLEIKAITRKRTTFEHALTRKIVRKADFLRYAEYEINLEALRMQRVKRMQIKGKKSISDWAGPRRIFFIFERATKRFHGDVSLWLQYIDYAKQQKSNKILGKTFTTALQYHPTNPRLWSLTAEHELHWNGNMSAARALMQRGLRLNTDAAQLWLDYFKLELYFLSKVYARREVLGIDQKGTVAEEALIEGLEESGAANVVQVTDLPEVSDSEDRRSQEALLKDIELSTLATASDNPALQGAIPMAILQAAVKSMPNKLDMLLDFYEIMSGYKDLPFRNTFLERILGLLSSDELKHQPQSCFLRTILPLTVQGQDVMDSTFPPAFKQTLALYQSAVQETDSIADLVGLWTQYLSSSFLVVPDLDVNLRKAIIKVVRAAYHSCELTKPLYGAWIKFERACGHEEDLAAVLHEAQTKYPEHEHF